MSEETIEVPIGEYDKLVADHTRINFFTGLGRDQQCLIIRRGDRYCIVSGMEVMAQGDSIRDVIDRASGTPFKTWQPYSAYEEREDSCKPS